MTITAAPDVATARRAPRLAPPVARVFVELVRDGLRVQRRAPLTWGGGLGAMSALMAAIWPSIADSMQRVVRSYPQGLKEAFGIQALDTVEQYIDAEMLSLIVPLVLAFFAVRCATRPTLGAEDRGELDTLLSLPISRSALALAGYAVAGVVLAEILTVIWVLTVVVAAIVGAGLSAATLAVGLANVWPLAMAFAGLAVFIAGLVRGQATVTALATATLVAMYLFDLVGKLAGGLAPLRSASAFRYYGSAIQDGIDGSHVVGLSLAGVVLALAGAVRFDRRDLG